MCWRIPEEASNEKTAKNKVSRGGKNVKIGWNGGLPGSTREDEEDRIRNSRGLRRLRRKGGIAGTDLAFGEGSNLAAGNSPIIGAKPTNAPERDAIGAAG
jgi:hypothetical protein